MTLKSVSQSCRDLVYPCRKHLFASIRLISPHSKHPRFFIRHLPNIESFFQLLNSNPDVADCVRHLHLMFCASSSHTIWILEQLHHLRSLKLEGCLGREDRMQLPLFRTAMLHLFPTLVELSLVKCSMPLDILASCSHLQKLGVQRFTVEERKCWEGVLESTENFHSISQLEELHLGDDCQAFLDNLCRVYNDGSPPLNLSRLRSLTFLSRNNPLDISYIEPMLKTWNPRVEVLTVSCELFVRDRCNPPVC